MIFELVQFSVIALVVYLVGKYYFLAKYRISFYEKQGVLLYKYYPLFGWLKDMVLKTTNQYKDCFRNMKEFSRDPKYKDQDILLSNIYERAFLTLVNPDLINEFLFKQNYYIKFQMPFVGIGKYIGNGLSNHYGDEWKSRRKLLSNLFSFENISNQVGRAKEITRRYLNNENLNHFNVKEVFEKIAISEDMQIILGTSVEQYKDSKGRHLGQLIEKFSEDLYFHYMGLLPTIFGQKFLSWGLRKSDREIHQRSLDMRDFMMTILRECVQKEKDPSNKVEYASLITFLNRDGLLNTEEDIKELLAISFNLYNAGKDNTSKIALVVAYYLIKFPEEYKKVKDEIDKYIINDDYTFADLQKLNHLQANIKEAMRMQTTSPLIFSRQALEDHTLGKYSIKKGTLITCGFLCNFFNEKYFEEPYKYNPDRWFDQTHDMKMKDNHFAFIPFSGGQRNCIGQHLAQMQIKVIIIEFMRIFKQPIYPPTYEEEIIMTQSYEFKHPFVISLEKRKNNQQQLISS